MSISEFVIGIIIAMIAAGLANIASGVIYDAYWNVGDTVHISYNCNELSSGWIVLCEDEKGKYERGKALIQLVSTIVPLLIVIVYIIRRL